MVTWECPRTPGNDYARDSYRSPKVTRGRQRSLVCQEIADSIHEITDLLAGLGHLEGILIENQEIADVLRLYKGGET